MGRQTGTADGLALRDGSLGTTGLGLQWAARLAANSWARDLPTGERPRGVKVRVIEHRAMKRLLLLCVLSRSSLLRHTDAVCLFSFRAVILYNILVIATHLHFDILKTSSARTA